MARSRKSQTKVGLNSKLSAVDLLTISYDGAAAIAEGAPIAVGATGAAVVPLTITDKLRSVIHDIEE